jgi:dinuclear metal center YbgI/SA1388 family protein
MELSRLVEFLDRELMLKEFPEDSSANGLQVEGASEVGKAAVAVDACEYVFQEAAGMGADFIFVHHGLIWGPIKAVGGPLKNRLKLLFDHDISLYACHLPLDAHPTLGNNARLLGLLGAEILEPFGEYHGKKIGFSGELPEEMDLDEFAGEVEQHLGTTCRTVGFGRPVKRIGAVSGGGGFAIKDAKGAGVDTLLTGEPSHSAYTLAEETGTNLVFAGHYATEALGVKAVGELLEKELGLGVEFIDHPTGL